LCLLKCAGRFIIEEYAGRLMDTIPYTELVFIVSTIKLYRYYLSL
jgi:hypothetical protein